MKSIYADFTIIDGEDRLFLSCSGTHKDLAKHHINLKNGLKLVFCSDGEDDNCNSEKEVPFALKASSGQQI